MDTQSTTVIDRSSPLGIKLLCGAVALYIGASLLGGLLGVGPSLTVFQGIPMAILGGVTLVWIAAALYGLWTGRRWGWLLALAYVGLNVVLYAGFAEFDLAAVAGSVLVGAYLYTKRGYYQSAQRSTPA